MDVIPGNNNTWYDEYSTIIIDDDVYTNAIWRNNTSTCSTTADSTDSDCYELATLTINGASSDIIVIDDITVSLIEKRPEPCLFRDEEVVYDEYWEFLDDIEYNFKVLYARNKQYICSFLLSTRSLYVRRLMCDRSGYIPYRRRRRM